MALRKLRIDGDPILRKKSKEVRKIDEKILKLLDDMADTMYREHGVGLSAPQVGNLKRVITVDVGDGLYKMINPEIIEEEGSSIDIEGCLSVPNFNGTVERPQKIKVKYLDVDGKEQIIEAENLFARCICHEVDHLNGILFKDKYIDEVSQEEMMELMDN